MANTDKIDFEAASQELSAGMAAYRETTGGPAEVEAIMTMADIVIQHQRDEQKGE